MFKELGIIDLSGSLLCWRSDFRLCYRYMRRVWLKVEEYRRYLVGDVKEVILVFKIYVSVVDDERSCGTVLFLYFNSESS